METVLYISMRGVQSIRESGWLSNSPRHYVVCGEVLLVQPSYVSEELSMINSSDLSTCIANIYKHPSHETG